MIDQLEMLGLFTAVLTALGLGVTLVSLWRSSRRAVSRRDLCRRAALDASAVVVDAFDAQGDVWTSAVVSGDRVAVAEGQSTPELRQVAKATLWQDARSGFGLCLKLGKNTLVVSGLEDMIRALGQLVASETAIDLDFAPGIGQRIEASLHRLHPKEAEILPQWLQEKEQVVAVVPFVRFEGAVPWAGDVTRATLLVTNARLALLVRTQVSEGGGMRRHFNLVGYPLPLVERIVASRTGGLRRQEWRLDMEYLPGREPSSDQTPPSLVLEQRHVAALFPVAICRTALRVDAQSPSLSRLLGEGLLSVMGFGVLGGLLVGLPYGLWWGALSDTWWMEDWVPAVAAVGFIGGGLLRALGTLERWLERRLGAAQGVA